ncbi:MAG: hypothetical protein KDD41_06505 [Flavobacteriales bacterium]|nr:hypothetical protein [Flavobacteriales bacterium]
MRLLTIILCFITLPSVGQLKADFKGNSLATDQFGYYYEVGDTEIKKYTVSGELYRTYSNNVLGVIASIDVSNPYKVVVYFRDFTKILILDNFLTPNSEVIDLTENDLDQTTLVCRSYNNGIWYYDPVRFELTRKNPELITTNNSGNLANLLGKNIQPNFIVEYNNELYLNDETNGILVFDLYGTYLKTIPIYGLSTFQVKDKYLIYANSQKQVETYDFFTLEKKQYKPEVYKDVRFVQVQNGSIFIVDENNALRIDKIEK